MSARARTLRSVRRSGREQHPGFRHLERSTTRSAGSSSDRTAPARRPCCRSRPRPSTRAPARPRSSARSSARWTCSSCVRGSGSRRPRSARRIPPNEAVLDAVMTAAYSVTGRWNEEYDEVDERARAARAAGVEARALEGPTVRHAERRRAEARADRPGRHDGSRNCCCWTSRPPAWTWARARNCSSCSAPMPRIADSPAIVMVTHHVEEIPPGFTHALLLADGTGARGRADQPRSSRARTSATAFGLPLVVSTTETGRFAARSELRNRRSR